MLCHIRKITLETNGCIIAQAFFDTANFKLGHYRLSKDVAFPAGVREVSVLRDGDRRVIVPADATWDDFFDGPGVDIERDQPAVQEREAF